MSDAEAQRRGRAVKTRVQRVTRAGVWEERCLLPAEEPLEVRVMFPGGSLIHTAGILRTPGNDFELTAGLIYTTGLVPASIPASGSIAAIRYCIDCAVDGPQLYNILQVDLRPGTPVARTGRSGDHTGTKPETDPATVFGRCGQSALADLWEQGWQPVPVGRPVLTADALMDSLDHVDTQQAQHAAVLLDADGSLLARREDIHLHNALNKVIGWAYLGDPTSLADATLLTPSTPDFDLVKQCVAVRLPVVASTSHPTSLAVDAAQEFGITLIGGLQPTGFTVYSAAERLAPVEGGVAGESRRR